MKATLNMISSLSLYKQWRCFQPKVSLLVSSIKSSQLILQCNYSDEKHSNVRFAPLCHRSIVQVCGKDSIDFLQGLLTNDVTKLAKAQCMYTMMLNKKGRVDHDILMYWPKKNDNNIILLDCQSESVDKIIKTLKLYKLRKKVYISVREDYSVWQMRFNVLMRYPKDVSDKVELTQYFSPNIFSSNINPYHDDAVIACNQDPRLSWLGWRIIATSQPCEDNHLENVDVYHTSRYFFGIPEGPVDLPPGKSLPFESNLDYMNGISFHKGCYLGQELTARSHFTGTIRKRLMPLLISSRSSKVIENNASLFDGKGTSVGKLRSTLDKRHGLGLVKLDRQLVVLTTMHGIKINVNETHWWPKKDSSTALNT